MARLQLTDFEPHVGSTFGLIAGPEEISLELDLVSATKAATQPHSADGFEPFSLLFRGPLEHKLTQMIRSLSHPELGSLQLFLVPVSEDDTGRFYEAIFN